MGINTPKFKRTFVSGRVANTTDPANSSYIAAGQIAFNLADKKAFGSNGSTVFEIGGVSADQAYTNATIFASNATNINTGTLTATVLPLSGVTANTYGNSSSIPVITVDQTGRITNVGTSAVAGVTDFQYVVANNTLTITTGAGTSFSANIGEVANLFNISTNLMDAGDPNTSYDTVLDLGDPTSLTYETLDSGNPYYESNNLFQEILNLTHLSMNDLQSSVPFSASISNNYSVTQIVPISGATLGDFVMASFSSDLLGCSISGYVSATDTVTVVVTNNTGNVINLPAGILAARVYKQSI